IGNENSLRAIMSIFNGSVKYKTVAKRQRGRGAKRQSEKPPFNKGGLGGFYIHKSLPASLYEREEKNPRTQTQDYASEGMCIPVEERLCNVGVMPQELQRFFLFLFQPQQPVEIQVFPDS
ncbi:MAG: hypothetical protein JXO48_06725, partial [Deltaproteobacteria bacterium]|nr:hypothetical protein [Deltaproteobacteria bacterium]